MELEIIYEDRDILLCRKPAGIATQTKRLGQQDMESLLKNYLTKKKEPPYIGVVHRLDQPVEGLMVFGKNQKATAALSKQVQKRMLGKHYYALVQGVPSTPEGELSDYLVTDKKSNVTSVVDIDATKGTDSQALPKEAKSARLEYKCLGSKRLGAEGDDEEEQGIQEVKESQAVQRTQAVSLLDIKLHTGRQHQIRVQCAHMGHPLVGDEKYGKTGEHQKEDRKAVPYIHKGERSQLALCSYRLEFVHPSTGKNMDFSIQPVNGSFCQFKEYLS